MGAGRAPGGGHRPAGCGQGEPSGSRRGRGRVGPVPPSGLRAGAAVAARAGPGHGPDPGKVQRRPRTGASGRAGGGGDPRGAVDPLSDQAAAHDRVGAPRGRATVPRTRIAGAVAGQRDAPRGQTGPCRHRRPLRPGRGPRAAGGGRDAAWGDTPAGAGADGPHAGGRDRGRRAAPAADRPPVLDRRDRRAVTLHRRPGGHAGSALSAVGGVVPGAHGHRQTAVAGTPWRARAMADERQAIRDLRR